LAIVIIPLTDTGTRPLSLPIIIPPPSTYSSSPLPLPHPPSTHLPQHTNYFEEIGAYYPSSLLHLWFVGPEINDAISPRKSARENVRAHFLRGNIGDLLLRDAEWKEKGKEWRKEAVVVGFNCGFGNYSETARYDCE